MLAYYSSGQVTKTFLESGYAACPYEVKLDSQSMDILSAQGLRGWHLNGVSWHARVSDVPEVLCRCHDGPASEEGRSCRSRDSLLIMGVHEPGHAPWREISRVITGIARSFHGRPVVSRSKRTPWRPLGDQSARYVEDANVTRLQMNT